MAALCDRQGDLAHLRDIFIASEPNNPGQIMQRLTWLPRLDLMATNRCLALAWASSAEEESRH